MAVNIPGLVAVIVFYIIILATGIWASRKSKREEEKCTGEKSEVSIVGGRNLSVWVGIFTMTATWVGGGYILGTAEVVYSPTQGMAWAIAPVGYALSLFCGGLFFAKPMRQKNFVTVMDPFQIRYGGAVTSAIFIFTMLAEVFWMACILSALGGTMKVILDIQSYQSILISAAVAILYTLLGGMYSVAYTDIIQLCFITVSLWLCIPFLLINPSTMDIRLTALNEVYQGPWLGTIDSQTVWRWLDDMFLVILAGVCFQSYYQRVLSAASPIQAQVTCYAAAIFCFFLGIPSVLFGAAAASTDWNQTSYGLPTPFEKGEAGSILPIALHNLCPMYISIAGIGAVAGAVMSSMDSALLSCTSMFTHNIYKGILRQKASDRELQFISRLGVLVFGVIGTGLAMSASSVYGLWLISGEMMYTAVFPQLVCTLFIPGSNGYGAIAGLLGGTTLRVLSGEPFFHISPVIHFPGCKLLDGTYVQFFPFKTFSMVVSLLIIVAVSYLTTLFFNWGLLPESWDIYNVKETSSSNQNEINLKEKASGHLENKSSKCTSEKGTQLPSYAHMTMSAI
uniref:High affinity choline transporter 1-like n=1 Tax=Erpetoichthys calabaricus TaxID=27687 RepID=A0A8C4X4J6_ERPCA